jgi:hypothetical protein
LNAVLQEHRVSKRKEEKKVKIRTVEKYEKEAKNMGNKRKKRFEGF